LSGALGWLSSLSSGYKPLWLPRKVVRGGRPRFGKFSLQGPHLDLDLLALDGDDGVEPERRLAPVQPELAVRVGMLVGQVAQVIGHGGTGPRRGSPALGGRNCGHVSVLLKRGSP